jgi:hypothetical protein
VSGTSNLNSVGNVTITGGSNGQVLTTNGNGILSWDNAGNADPAFAATGSGNTVISTAYTATQVAFATETLDTHGWFANNRYTPQRSGWYQISGGARCFITGGLNNTEASVQLRKNGTTSLAVQGGYGAVTGSVSQLVQFNGTSDYVDFCINCGNTGNVGQQAIYTYFTGSWIRS